MQAKGLIILILLWAWAIGSVMMAAVTPTAEAPAWVGVQSNNGDDSTLEIIRKVSDWQMVHLPPGEHKNWIEATSYAGLMATYETTGEPRYRDRATAWAEANRWSLGRRLRNADDQCAGQTYLELYGLEPIPERLEPTKQVLDAMIADPRPGRVDWSWCDALFMAPPVFARMGAATDDGRYFDRMSDMWWDTTDYLFDTDYGLFYRDASFFNRQCPNGEKMFWSRGNGWVMAGTVRVLEYLPSDHPDRNRFIELLRTMAASVASLQKKDGFWPSCLTDPENYPWPETSGTSAFCYGLAWGINQGFLDAETYRPVVQNAWNALVRAVDADGKLGWVQPVGSQPGPSRASDSRPYGVGLFLLAASEVFKYEYDGSTAVWTALGKYIEGTTSHVNAYLNGIQYDEYGRLHATWCWRQTPASGTNHDLMYAYSDDYGRTWNNNDGVQVGVTGRTFIQPSSPGITVWPIPQRSGLLNQEGQTVDRQGRIHVLMRDALSGALRYVHYYRGTEGVWHRNVLPLAPPRARGKIATDAKDNVYALLPNLVIAAASASSHYTDWAVIDDSDDGRFTREPLYDPARLHEEGVLSTFNVSSEGNGCDSTPL